MSLKTPSAVLAEIVGDKPLERTEITKRIWAYVRANKLSAGRTIKTDAKLKAVFKVDSLNMFEMQKALSPHLS